MLYGIILDPAHRRHAAVRDVCEKAHGHVVTTILIGMVAMLFTAISYGRMANAYPTRGLGLHLCRPGIALLAGLSHGLGDDLRLRA